MSISAWLVAAISSFLGEPQWGPEDLHERPAAYQESGLELAPQPWADHAEYPLAVTFNPADPSNYTAGGMISYDYVVVHTMQGSYYGAQSWFQNPDADVSAHFCMRSEDGEVTQMVHLADRAWHVGNSNPYSIGIEHEGFVDEPAWYTWPNYVQSALLSRWIADDRGIPLDRDHIVGHVELPNQTHTDPGIHWNWDLYMALIWDVVPQARVEGRVVDRAGCTITTTADTWFKRTLQQSDELGDTDKCFVAAGTELSYLHASPPMVGHHRLDYEVESGPCAGFIDLDAQSYVFADHLSATCSEAETAAAGVTVRLDGAIDVVTDANGWFVFEDVGPGSHTLDVLGAGTWADTLVPFDMTSYPGVRLIVGVDPLENPGDGDGDETDGECWIGAEGCPCTPGGGCDPGLACSPASWTCKAEGDTGEAGDEADSADEVGSLDAGFTDERGGDSCSVVGEPTPISAWLALGLFALTLGRGRRVHDPSRHRG